MEYFFPYNIPGNITLIVCIEYYITFDFETIFYAVSESKANNLLTDEFLWRHKIGRLHLAGGVITYFTKFVHKGARKAIMPVTINDY